eukprot:325880-Chlamydomonas_euryale.AAC.15
MFIQDGKESPSHTQRYMAIRHVCFQPALVAAKSVPEHRYARVSVSAPKIGTFSESITRTGNGALDALLTTPSSRRGWAAGCLQACPCSRARRRQRAQRRRASYWSRRRCRRLVRQYALYLKGSWRTAGVSTARRVGPRPAATAAATAAAAAIAA